MAACTPSPTLTLYSTDIYTTSTTVTSTSTIFASDGLSTFVTASPLVVNSLEPTSTLYSSCPTTTPLPPTTTTPTTTSTPTTTTTPTPTQTTTTTPFSVTISTPSATASSTTNSGGGTVSETITITSASPTSSTSAGQDTSGSNSSGGSSNTGAIVGGVVGGLGGAALIALLLFCFCRRRRRKDNVAWGAKDGDSDFFSPVSGDQMRDGAAGAGAGYGVTYAAANSSRGSKPQRSSSQVSRLTTGSYNSQYHTGHGSGSPTGNGPSGSYSSHNNNYYTSPGNASQVSPSIYSTGATEMLGAGAAGIGAGAAAAAVGAGAARRPSQRTYGSNTAYGNHARTGSGGSADFDHRRSGSYGNEFAGYAIPEHGLAQLAPPVPPRRGTIERPTSPGAASVQSQPRFGGLGGTLHVANPNDDAESNYGGGLTQGALARLENGQRTQPPWATGMPSMAPTQRGPPSYTTQPRAGY